MKGLFVRVVGIGLIALIAGCSKTTESRTTASSDDVSSASVSSLDTARQALVKFKLTDAPNKSLKSVIVDIDHMEVLLAGQGKSGRLKVAKGLGPVDLLTLQNGVTLPLEDVVAPAGLQIQQIRLVLKSEGHYAVKSDGSSCELKTPSAQKTGVKIILTNKVQFEAGHEYNIVVDFDALKSVVVRGNGECLLKPVLKLKSAYKSPIIVDDENSEDDGEDHSGGGSSEDPTDGGGSSEEDEVFEEDSDAVDGGEELVTEPNENENVDDGWDYTPIVDGEEIPEISADQLDQLL